MKLTTSETCAILLSNGHICEVTYTNKKRPYISVHQENYTAGHITQKQFYEMIEADLIKFNSSRKDKYGNVYNYYEICKGE